MDEKTSNQMINLLISIEQRLSHIARVLDDQESNK